MSSGSTRNIGNSIEPGNSLPGWRILLTIYWWLWSLSIPKSVKKDYLKTIAIVDTPLKVQAWLWANIKYRKDTRSWHHWQSALVTFNEKEGDCEDWAVFASECLKEKYEGYFLCMYTEDSGHASYLMSIKDEDWISVGTFGLQSHQGDIPEIIPDWLGYKKWRTATLEDEDMNFIDAYYR